MAALAMYTACCLHPGPEDGGSGTSAGATSSGGSSGGASTGSSTSSGTTGTAATTNSSSSSQCTPNSGSSSGAAATQPGSIECGTIQPGCNDFGYPGAGLAFCSEGCFGGNSEGSCLEAICPACSGADGLILEGPVAEAPVFFGGLCPYASCEYEQLQCLKEDSPTVLSPSCATAVIGMLDTLLDGGPACLPDPKGGWYSLDFCLAIDQCVGGAACDQLICPACTLADDEALGTFGQLFFGGLCPVPSTANPCADLECFVDAGRTVLSPGCAAAVSSLLTPFLDGGLDGG